MVTASKLIGQTISHADLRKGRRWGVELRSFCLALLIIQVYCLLLPEMVKRLFTLFCGVVVALSLSSATFAQETPAQEKKMGKTAKEARWDGIVARSNSEQSTLTIRKVGSDVVRIVHYDSSTRWVSQEHGSKKVNDIDASQVKDGDRVIVKGAWDKNELHATLISKRLSHSQ
jgi:hypothetical protein